MARPLGTSGSIESLGRLLVAAYACDDDWMKQGRCAGWNASGEHTPTPWQFDFDQVEHDSQGRELKGSEMIELALMVCFGCPVQYECAHYAVCGQMRAGTYSMKISDMRWLQARTQKVRDQLFAYAIAEDLPMQRVVEHAREIWQAEEDARKAALAS